MAKKPPRLNRRCWRCQRFYRGSPWLNRSVGDSRVNLHRLDARHPQPAARSLMTGMAGPISETFGRPAPAASFPRERLRRSGIRLEDPTATSEPVGLLDAGENVAIMCVSRDVTHVPSLVRGRAGTGEDAGLVVVDQ